MRREIYIVALAFLLAPAFLSASSTAPQIATNLTQFTDWIPIIVIAMLVSASLVSGYYMIGVALNNSKVKGQAMSEFYQVIGTAVMVVLILFILGIFGTALTSTSTIVSPSQMSTICRNYLSNSQFYFTNSIYVPTSCTTGQSGCAYSPTNLVCSQLIGAEVAQAPSVGPPGHTGYLRGQTANLDYGLAAVYVINANLTDQTLHNLDALYLFDLEVGWLRTFTSSTVFCMPFSCAIPLLPRDYWIEYSYQPFPAYVLQRGSMPPVEISETLMFYMQFLIMTIIILFLYAWPWILAAGIILRTFFFTRRSGGFLIAFVVIMLLVYPIVYLSEYSSLNAPLCRYGTVQNPGVIGSATPVPAGTTGTGSCVELIGTNSLPNMQIDELPVSDSFTNYINNNPKYPQAQPPAKVYQLSFFNMPDMAAVLNYYGCYPKNLIGTEIEFASNYLIPGEGLSNGALSTASGGFALLASIFNIFGQIGGGVSAQATQLTLPDLIGGKNAFYCFTPTGMANATIAMINVYGVMAVTTFIIPLFNVLIALSGILGLSGLLGGDTNLVGLGRFI